VPYHPKVETRFRPSEACLRRSCGIAKTGFEKDGIGLMAPDNVDSSTRYTIQATSGVPINSYVKAANRGTPSAGFLRASEHKRCSVPIGPAQC